VAKAPIAVMLMVAEMTNEFSMVVPAMLATTVAYLITGDVRIYEHQVPTRADSPAHRGEYTIPLIQAITAEQAMKSNVATCSPEDSIDVAERRMTQQRRRGLPVVKDGKLVGIFTASDAMRAHQKGDGMVNQHMTTELIVAHPMDSLHDVMQRMAAANISRVPVVDPNEPGKLLGILSNRDIAAALDLEVNALAAASRGVVELVGRARAFASNADGNVGSLNIRVRSFDRSAGKTLAELRLPADCVVTAVYRDGTLLIPRGNLRLEAGDRVQLLAARSVHRDVLARMRGEE
jgi:CIC family chloride channel protein